MAILRKFFSYTFKILLIGILLLLISNLFSYLFQVAPLKPPKPFSGDKIYNPYENFKGNWNKVGLHLHSKQNLNLARLSPKEIISTYKKYNYKAIILTDYFKFTDTSDLQDIYIPAYEFGRNIRKKHLLSLNPKSTEVWDFFPFFAKLENIQHTINKLSSDGGFLILAHPSVREAFSERTISELSGFQAIEVLSPFATNLGIIDNALSAGRFVRVMAGDDLHYIPINELAIQEENFIRSMLLAVSKNEFNTNQPLKRYILIDTNLLTKDNLIPNLCKGSFIVVQAMMKEEENPKINFIGIEPESNKIKLTLGEQAISIKFIGQAGKTLAYFNNSDKGEYDFKQEDTYVRIEIIFQTKIVLLNAFFRYDSLDLNCN